MFGGTTPEFSHAFRRKSVGRKSSSFSGKRRRERWKRERLSSECRARRDAKSCPAAPAKSRRHFSSGEGPLLPGMVFQLFNKLILQNSRIRSFQCRELTIHRKQPGVAHFDGDPVLLSADIPVRIVQGGLQVVTPRHVEYAPIEQVQNFINPVSEEVATFNRQTLARNIEFLKSLFRKRLPPAGK